MQTGAHSTGGKREASRAEVDSQGHCIVGQQRRLDRNSLLSPVYQHHWEWPGLPTQYVYTKRVPQVRATLVFSGKPGLVWEGLVPGFAPSHDQVPRSCPSARRDWLKHQGRIPRTGSGLSALGTAEPGATQGGWQGTKWGLGRSLRNSPGREARFRREVRRGAELTGSLQ